MHRSTCSGAVYSESIRNAMGISDRTRIKSQATKRTTSPRTRSVAYIARYSQQVQEGDWRGRRKLGSDHVKAPRSLLTGKRQIQSPRPREKSHTQYSLPFPLLQVLISLPLSSAEKQTQRSSAKLPFQAAINAAQQLTNEPGEREKEVEKGSLTQQEQPKSSHNHPSSHSKSS